MGYDPSSVTTLTVPVACVVCVALSRIVQLYVPEPKIPGDVLLTKETVDPKEYHVVPSAAAAFSAAVPVYEHCIS